MKWRVLYDGNFFIFNLVVEKFETVDYLFSMFHSEKLLVPRLMSLRMRAQHPKLPSGLACALEESAPLESPDSLVLKWC